MDLTSQHNIHPSSNPTHIFQCKHSRLLLAGGVGRAAEVLTFVALAIGAGLVGIESQQALDHLLVLSSLARGWTARHGRDVESRSDVWEAKEGESRWPVWEAVSSAVRYIEISV